MSKQSHTPGPWFGRRDNDPVLIAGHYEVGLEIAFSCSPQPERRAEYKANARLIAAAPELLEALQWAMSQSSMTYAQRLKQNTEWCDAVDKARAAIAKATGEQA